MDKLQASNGVRQPVQTGRKSVCRTGRRRRQSLGFWARLACVTVALAALVILARQIGLGVVRVKQGEITVAQMLTELGDWLRGASPDGTQDDRTPSGEPDGTIPDASLPQDTPTVDALEQEQQAAREQLYAFDRAKLPLGVRAIVPVNLAEEPDDEQTRAALCWQVPDYAVVDGEPLVLVVHAHASEGYTPKGVDYLSLNEVVGRSDLAQESVVGVGEVLVRELERLGVPTCHVTTLFDAQGNAGSFDRAAEQIAQCLERYPSIRYVIDLHRDAGLDASGDVLRAVTLHEGEVLAQMRLLASGQESYWLAAALANELNADGAQLCRPIERIEMPSSWKWEGVSVLRVEVGTAGNSPDEAGRAAQPLARVLTGLIERGSPDEASS